MSNNSLPEEWGKRLALIAAAVIVFSLCAIEEWQIDGHWFLPHAAITSADKFILADHDQVVAEATVSKLPTFTSTWHLWTTADTGCGHYWRPLLWMGVWAEYQRFGVSGYAGYVACMVASHLLFLAGFAVVVKQITGRWSAALLSVLFFAGSRAYPPMSWANNLLFGDPLWSAGAAGDVALVYWKDQAEMWHGAFVLLALYAALRGRWFLGIAGFAGAVLVKESGWLAPVLVLVVLLIEGRLREAPLRAWIGFIMVAALLVFGKVHAGLNLTASGNFHGMSGAPYRYFHLVGGRGLLGMTGVSWAAGVIGAGLGLVAALGVQRRVAWRAGLGTWAVLAACVAGIWAHVEGHGYVASLLAMFDPVCFLPLLLGEFVYAFCAVVVLCESAARRPMAILIAASLLGGLPTIVNAWETPHINYLTYSFQSAITAFVWVCVGDRIWDALSICAWPRLTALAKRPEAA
ncbi:MAG: hypothetical protein P4L33_11880 [Capsulimonadaceae bacterium]|nr:hypothetical protein [Capsulimonadaceae bacterium]